VGSSLLFRERRPLDQCKFSPRTQKRGGEELAQEVKNGLRKEKKAEDRRKHWEDEERIDPHLTH